MIYSFKVVWTLENMLNNLYTSFKMVVGMRSTQAKSIYIIEKVDVAFVN
jgi:hypothetical protein